MKKYYKYKTIPGIVYTIRQVTAKQDEWQRILPKPAANPYLNDHLALVKALQCVYMIEMTAKEIQELNI